MFQQPRPRLIRNIQIRDEDINSITDEIIQCFRLISQVIVAMSLDAPEEEIEPIKAEAIEYARGKQEELEHPVLRVLILLLISATPELMVDDISNPPEIIATANDPKAQELLGIFRTMREDRGWLLPLNYKQNTLRFCDQVKEASREYVYIFR